MCTCFHQVFCIAETLSDFFRRNYSHGIDTKATVKNGTVGSSFLENTCGGRLSFPVEPELEAINLSATSALREELPFHCSGQQQPVILVVVSPCDRYLR